MKIALPLLLLGFLLCSCHRREAEVSASFDFSTGSPEKAASFYAEFDAFLTKNGFKKCPARPDLSQGGPTSSEEQNVWMTGTFHGSAPFYLHYESQDGDQILDIHAVTTWEVSGSKREISVMKDAVREFSAELEKIAARHR